MQHLFVNYKMINTQFDGIPRIQTASGVGEWKEKSEARSHLKEL